MNYYQKLSTPELLRSAAVVVDDSKLSGVTWHQLADALYERAARMSKEAQLIGETE